MLTTWFRTPKTTARTKSITQLLNYRRPLSSSTTVFKMPAPFQYKQPEHRLTLIPGPIEFSDDVLASMAIPSQAHTSPDFIYTFQYVLQNLRKLFKSTDANTQGYVLSGSGTLGWDVAATNIIEPGEKVLVLSTGFFSDSFAECLKVYGADVDVITAEIGDVVPLDKIKDGDVTENEDHNLLVNKAIYLHAIFPSIINAIYYCIERGREDWFEQLLMAGVKVGLSEDEIDNLRQKHFPQNREDNMPEILKVPNSDIFYLIPKTS